MEVAVFRAFLEVRCAKPVFRPHTSRRLYDVTVNFVPSLSLIYIFLFQEKLSVIDPDDRVRQLFKAFDVRCKWPTSLAPYRSCSYIA